MSLRQIVPYLALCALPALAPAELIYEDLHSLAVPRGGSMPFAPIPGLAGTLDFHPVGNEVEGQLLWLRASNGAAMVGRETYCDFIACAPNAVFNLSSGTLVQDSTPTTIDPVHGAWGFPVYSVMGLRLPPGDPVPDPVEGTFGFRIEDGAGLFHYGWFHIRQVFEPGDEVYWRLARVELVDYAYESNPDTPVCAGDRGLRADMNCDGAVNNFDIDPFMLALTDPDSFNACNIVNADVNADGAINNFDIDPFVICLVNGGCQ
jgi:hypothetical protein